MPATPRRSAARSSSKIVTKQLKPKPADRYFGLHFDLHPNGSDTELGRLVTEPMVRAILRAAKPDYIQYDCKGHVGFLGYSDSKISRSASGIINDSLAIYRKVTAKAGVPLLVHFSGVWDDQAVLDHPQWAAVDAQGKPSTQYTSTFSAYVTERMIPQMKEVIDRYQVDGFWVDGDAWAAQVDYCSAAIEKFRQATGEQTPPTEPGQPFWVQWMRVHRDQFFEYVQTYVNAIRDYAPHVRVASNWLYSPIAPEPMRLPMPFISGDYSSTDSVNSARFNARQMSNVGLPWDLMAWAFVWAPGVRGNIYKSPQQLQQEAANVLALGGGFQMYFPPDRHGGFADWHIDLMQEVADFCHERRAVCFESQPIPQVAVVLDTTTLNTISPKVFSPWQGEYVSTMGLLHAAIESRHSADVLVDHQLHGDFDRWPVIALPDTFHLAPALIQELVDYVKRGGSLLVTGARTCALFKEYLSVSFVGEPVEKDALLHPIRSLQSPLPGRARLKGLWQEIALPTGKSPSSKNVKLLATRNASYRGEIDPTPAVTLTKLGRGKIAAFFGPLGQAYFSTHTPWLRDFTGVLLDQLYRPIVRVAGEGSVDLVLRTKNDRTAIHLVNNTAMPTSIAAGSEQYWHTDHIPPTAELALTVRCPVKPRAVRSEPGAKKLSFTWQSGELSIVVPSVHIHTAIVIET
jgi:hypothetical protein